MADIKNQNSEIIIFKTADEKVSVNVIMENETVWLTQEQMADKKFGISKEDQRLTSEFYNDEK